MDVQPRKPSLRGPEDWFTGEVSVDLITNGHGPTPLSLGNIRFSPGARTAWHAHSIAQTLYITEGEGRVQARGEAIRTVRPGDTVHVGTTEWHWHGGAPDQPMTHVSLTEGETEWGEHVTDAEYLGGSAG